MYDELVKRLRERAQRENDYYEHGGDVIIEAADAIEELSAAVEGYEANTNMVFDRSGNNTVVKFEPKWIPVTERLPEPKFAREWYLVSLRSGCVKTLAFEKGGRTDNLFRPGWHETASPVTHWMPLPQPPKEET